MEKVRLETKRLIIREFNESDILDVYEYSSDEEVCKYLAFGPESLENTEDYLEKNLAAQFVIPRIRYDLAICIKSEFLDENQIEAKAENQDPKLIGGIGLFLQASKSAELGYILNRKFWNRGYTSEAADVMIKFGFSELGLHRIWASCHIENIASVRVLQKIGMQKEGILRSYLPIDGEWHTSLLYAIIEDDLDIETWE